MKLLLKRSFDHRLIYVLIHCRHKLILISFLFHVYVTAYMFMGLELGLSFIVVIVTCHLHELILPTFSFQLKMLNQIAVKLNLDIITFFVYKGRLFQAFYLDDNISEDVLTIIQGMLRYTKVRSDLQFHLTWQEFLLGIVILWNKIVWECHGDKRRSTATTLWSNKGSQ